jgi:hypothetical protein
LVLRPMRDGRGTPLHERKTKKKKTVRVSSREHGRASVSKAGDGVWRTPHN